MATYSQANRAIAITTSLGPDALLLEKVTGAEAISELFQFRLDLLATAPIDFGKVLNQWATIRITSANGSGRTIHGIIVALAQGGQVLGPAGKDSFVRYTAELVPAFWRLSKRVQSRVFQNVTVPQILETVLKKEWRLDVAMVCTSSYESRNYCTQYQESDFAFLSRLMEEEGIGYYFKHEGEGENARHTLVVTDAPSGYVRLSSGADVVYQPKREGTPSHQPVIWDWVKRQEVTAPEHTLMDYHFQVPASRLHAKAALDREVVVGQVTHPLRFSHKVADQEMLENFEYPGRYGHRFDEVDPEGNPRSQEMGKLYDDSKRAARLWAQEAAARSVRIDGAGTCIQFSAGQQFNLTRHFDGDGGYLLTRVELSASIEGTYTSADNPPVGEITNAFEAIPAALPFRPRRRTPKPRIDGTQTATVVAPGTMPAFLDQYGRVKLKFHWDRLAAAGANTSCWVRVAQVWAGKGWGAFFWPRVGHEVVVSFENGDPDRPLVIGSVYNAENLPALSPAAHPDSNGFKSCSYGGNPLVHFNSLVMHDTQGDEHVQIHSETHEVITSKQSKYQNTPGPELEFCGSLAMPPGSGSGGGWLECAELGDVSKGQHSSLMKALPGKSTMVCGEQFGATLGGGRTTHVLGGGDVKMVFDPEALLEQGLGMIPGVGGALASLAALGLGVGGNTDFVVSPKAQSVFFGPLWDFRHAPSFEYRYDKVAAAGAAPIPSISTSANRCMMAFATLTMATAMAGDIMARCKATIKGASDKPVTDKRVNQAVHDEEKKKIEEKQAHAVKEVDAVPPWTTLVGVGLAGRFHAILLIIETSFAGTQMGKKDADHAEHICHSWSYIWAGDHVAHHGSWQGVKHYLALLGNKLAENAGAIALVVGILGVCAVILAFTIKAMLHR